MAPPLLGRFSPPCHWRFAIKLRMGRNINAPNLNQFVAPSGFPEGGA